MTEQEQRFLQTYNDLPPAKKELVQAYIDDLNGDGIKPHYSLKTAAGILDVTYRTALEYIRSDKLKAHKAAGKYIIYADDLKAFIDGK